MGFFDGSLKDRVGGLLRRPALRSALEAVGSDDAERLRQAIRGLGTAVEGPVPDAVLESATPEAVNRWQGMPLMSIAVDCGSVDCVHVLLDAGAGVRRKARRYGEISMTSALQLAVRRAAARPSGRDSVLDVLVERCADDFVQEALDGEGVRGLIGPRALAGSGLTALLETGVDEGYFETVVARASSTRVDLHERIRAGQGCATLARIAVSRSNARALRALIEALGPEAVAGGERGEGLMMQAASRGSVPCIDLLAGAGASVAGRRPGRSPLEELLCTARDGRGDPQGAAAALLRAGADPFEATENNEPVIDVARRLRNGTSSLPATDAQARVAEMVIAAANARHLTERSGAAAHGVDEARSAEGPAL